MAFLIDHYGPNLKTPTALLKHLRVTLKFSCSQERFKTLYRQYLRKYVPTGFLKNK